MKLHYCETLNPRKACAVARYLDLPVEYVWVDLAKGAHKSPDFLALNPNGKVPVLEDGGKVLWESNAIMCYLSDKAGADLWPHDERQIDVIRWLSWDAQHFTTHAGMLYFENIVKPLIGLGEAHPKTIERSLGGFRSSAAVLEAHLQKHDFLAGDELSVADFATAITLPYAGKAGIPLDEFPAMARWHDRLNALPGWREPFPQR